jgi:hypothetical protein
MYHWVASHFRLPPPDCTVLYFYECHVILLYTKLKRQYHEIFYIFFHDSAAPSPLINIFFNCVSISVRYSTANCRKF